MHLFSLNASTHMYTTTAVVGLFFYCYLELFLPQKDDGVSWARTDDPWDSWSEDLEENPTNKNKHKMLSGLFPLKKFVFPLMIIC